MVFERTPGLSRHLLTTKRLSKDERPPPHGKPFGQVVQSSGWRVRSERVADQFPSNAAVHCLRPLESSRLGPTATRTVSIHRVPRPIGAVPARSGAGGRESHSRRRGRAAGRRPSSRGEFLEPGLGRFGDAGEDMQPVRRVFENKLSGCEAEMLLGTGYCVSIKDNEVIGSAMVRVQPFGEGYARAWLTNAPAAIDAAQLPDHERASFGWRAGHPLPGCDRGRHRSSSFELLRNNAQSP